MSWLLYSGKPKVRVDSGNDAWKEIVAELSGQIKEARVIAAGRKTFYGLTDNIKEIDKKIPFEKDCYQIRTVEVPGLDDTKPSYFFAVACNSFIETISSELASSGLRLSSLEVPATVLSRKAESQRKQAQALLQVHVGYKYTQFLLSFHGYPYVAREIGYGLDDFVVQYSTHLKVSPETALLDLGSHQVEEAGPVEPAVVKLLEQGSRTVAKFPSRIDAVSVLGPGALKGLQTRFARHFQASEIASTKTGSESSILLETNHT